MKKLIASIILLASTLSAAAQDKFTYYMMTTTNSPMMRVSEPLVAKLKETYDIDYRQNVGCTVKTQVDRDKTPMFVEVSAGIIFQSLYDNNTSCIIDMSNIRWLMVFEAKFKVCVKADSPIANWQDLLKANEPKFGYAAGTTGRPTIESLNKDLPAKFKPVMLTNSNTAIIALLAKDIDVALVNALVADNQIEIGTIRCIASTEVGTDTSLSKLSPKTNKLLSEYSLTFGTGVKNVTDQQYAKIVEQIKITLPKADLPKNAKVFSVIDYSEKDLRTKIDDATFKLYEAIK